MRQPAFASSWLSRCDGSCSAAAQTGRLCMLLPVLTLPCLAHAPALLSSVLPTQVM